MRVLVLGPTPPACSLYCRMSSAVISESASKPARPAALVAARDTPLLLPPGVEVRFAAALLLPGLDAAAAAEEGTGRPMTAAECTL